MSGNNGISRALTQGVIDNPFREGLVAPGSILPQQKVPELQTAPKPTAEVPNVDSDAIKKARLKSFLTLKQRSGRASTLLTNTFG